MDGDARLEPVQLNVPVECAQQARIGLESNEARLREVPCEVREREAGIGTKVDDQSNIASHAIHCESIDLLLEQLVGCFEIPRGRSMSPGPSFSLTTMLVNIPRGRTHARAGIWRGSRRPTCAGTTPDRVAWAASMLAHGRRCPASRTATSPGSLESHRSDRACFPWPCGPVSATKQTR